VPHDKKKKKNQFRDRGNGWIGSVASSASAGYFWRFTFNRIWGISKISPWSETGIDADDELEILLWVRWCFIDGERLPVLIFVITRN
jgi:hypothetical protein